MGYKMYRMAQLFSRALDERLLTHGVSVGQFRLLLVLWEQEQLTQAEIAAHLGIEQPTVASTLKRMERDGLIEISDDPADGRRKRIGLTERSQALKATLLAEAQSINERAVSGLSTEEIAQFHHAVDAVAAALSLDR